MNIRCSCCCIEKKETDFYKNKARVSGFDSLCKACRKKTNDEYRNTNRAEINIQNKEYYERNKDKVKIRLAVYRKTNRETIRISERKYIQKNPEKHTQRVRSWQKRNPERFREIVKKSISLNWDKILESQRIRRKNNPQYRLYNRMRSGFKGWLNGKQKSCSVETLVGLTKEKFVEYIESQFKDGMDWNNIHIDHYIPLSFFNPENKEDMYICWNYLNMRPLIAVANIAKSNSLPSDYLKHIEMIRRSLTTAST